MGDHEKIVNPEDEWLAVHEGGDTLDLLEEPHVWTTELSEDEKRAERLAGEARLIQAVFETAPPRRLTIVRMTCWNRSCGAQLELDLSDKWPSCSVCGGDTWVVTKLAEELGLKFGLGRGPLGAA